MYQDFTTHINFVEHGEEILMDTGLVLGIELSTEQWHLSDQEGQLLVAGRESPLKVGERQAVNEGLDRPHRPAMGRSQTGQDLTL